ncbi:HSP20-like chaperone [Tribonema minus]|uniref:HSP20-like chaperone n=1 Tax=Tribonema minus TaxID=303371 RepID=A0A835YUR0_9STRA|nr:HSP20-like chaperone [Tribonema minus]
MSLIPRSFGGGWGSPFDEFATDVMPWGGGMGAVSPWGGGMMGGMMGGPLARSVMAPNMLAMDIRETDTGYDMRFDVPGVTKDDIRVSVDENRRTATVSTEKRTEKEDWDPAGWHTRERSAGRAMRTIALPWDSDSNKVDVRYENGVLHMMCPKSETPPGRRLAIR